ncbi:hypothetical protein SpCBS45565_g01958 [Spizellomyces sp. 'palustris']|nr:hypothetical protein SpCBS45565_g01958 [Spizellomyces sp. 'palustris']
MPPRSSRYRVSYIIKEDYGEKQLHRAGINSLVLDETTPTELDGQAGGLLYTAGRDSIVNVWECHIDKKRYDKVVREREIKMRMHQHVHSPYRNDSLQVPGLGGSRELHRSRSNTGRKPRSPFPHSFLSPQRQSLDSASPTLVINGPNGAGGLQLVQEPGSSDEDMGHHGPLLDHEAGESMVESPGSASSPLDGPVEGMVFGSPPETGRPPLPPNHLPNDPGYKRDEMGFLRKTRSVTFGGKSSSSLIMQGGIPAVPKSFSSMDIDRVLAARTNWHQQPPATLRRSFQHHSDWVNDIVLCNHNQHLLSASNDRTIYVTSTTAPSSPIMIGHHSDYVKCLAYSKHRGWVASGGLDHRILLWDLGEGRGHQGGLSVSDTAEVVLNETSPKTSVYALACNPAGNVLVSGSPDKIVRVWDFAQGKNVMRLTGHTENIRSALVSDDGKWVLSASSDATIKLWSLAMPHRPMVTYTHYEDSVYCLYSSHPDLDTFWAGGRDGWVTKLSRRRMVESSALSSRSVDDELVDCVAICKETGPVNKIVAINDMYIWTATAGSSVKRWRDVPFQHVQLAKPGMVHDTTDETDPVIIPLNAIIRPPTALDDAASMRSYRPFSTYSVDTFATGGVSLIPLRGEEEEEPPIEPAWKEPDGIVQGAPGISKCIILNNRRHIITLDTEGEVAMWDIIQCVKLKNFGKLDFEEVVKRTNTVEWVANWCSVDTHNGVLTIHLDESKCYDAEVYHDECGVSAKAPNEEQRVNLGKWVLTYLFRNFINAWYSPRRSSLDPTGASPPRPPDNERPSTISMPSQTFEGDLLRVHMTPSVVSPTIMEATTGYFDGESMRKSVDTVGSVSASLTTESMKSVRSEPVLSIPLPPESVPPPAAFSAANSLTSLSSIPSTDLGPKSAPPDMEALPTPNPPSPPSRPSTPPSVPPSPSAGDRTQSFMDKFKFHVRRRTSSSKSEEFEHGKKKGIDRNGSKGSRMGSAKREDEGENGDYRDQDERPPRETLPALPHPPLRTDSITSHINTTETPPLRLPPALPVLISIEESSEAATYLDIYRGMVGAMGWVEELTRVEKSLPPWVFETVVEGKPLTIKENSKLSFGLSPMDNMEELPGGNPRLSANRMLRIRKLSAYVIERLGLDVPSGLKPEEFVQIWCGEECLQPDMTLATVRHCVWKGGGEVGLKYRMKT